jgi:hypothetical protein
LRSLFARAQNQSNRAESPKARPVPDKSILSPTNVALSLLGGLAGAVVFAVLSKGPSMGPMLLAQLSPLPVMIIALGLGAVNGATAALAGALAITAGLGPLFGMAYGLFVALPAWAASYAALGASFGPRRDLVTRRFSGAAATALAAALSAAVILFLAIAFFSHNTIEEPLAYVEGELYVQIQLALKELGLDEAVPKPELDKFAQYWLPALIASAAMLLHAVNLWIAGRLTQASGMLKQPWPDLARDFEVPRAVAIVFVLAILGTFLGGFVRQAAMVLAFTTGLALAFQGLAVTHFWLRNARAGVAVMAILYFLVGVCIPAISLFAIPGLLDAGLRFRDRKTVGGDERVQP